MRFMSEPDLTKEPLEKLFQMTLSSGALSGYAQTEIERRKQIREDRIISATEKMLTITKISLAVSIIALVVSIISFLKSLIG